MEMVTEAEVVVILDTVQGCFGESGREELGHVSTGGAVFTCVFYRV